MHSPALARGIVLRAPIRTAGVAVALFAAATLSGGVAVAQQSASASAQVMDANGQLVGTATFTQVAGGVQVSGRFTGLTPGQHGIHVHTNGVCEGPDFTTAGGHFNPTNRQHGFENPQGAHAGDLPNLVVGPDGTGSISAVAQGTTLSPGPESLLKSGGTALVIHADSDDEMTDPAGNSGTRIACGVIVAGAQAASPVQLPAALPRTGDLADASAAIAAAGAVLAAVGFALRRARRI